MYISGRQIRGARGLLDWTMKDLSERSGINRLTIRQIEGEEVQPQRKTIAIILAVFESAGVIFHENNGISLCKNFGGIRPAPPMPKTLPRASNEIDFFKSRPKSAGTAVLSPEGFFRNCTRFLKS